MPRPVDADSSGSTDPLVGESAWAAYGALVTLGFVVATITGLAGRPLTMAAGAGTAALASGVCSRLDIRSLTALGAVPLATAAAVGGGYGRELAGVVLVLSLLELAKHRVRGLVGAAGAALLLGGVSLGRSSTVAPGASTVAALLLALAAVVLIAVAVERIGPLTVLLAPGLIAGVAAAGGTGVEPRVAVALAGLVAVVSIAFERPAAALAALSVSASIGVDEPAIAVLLGAAAVLVAAWPLRPTSPAVIVCVPALAGLALAVTAHPTAQAVGVGAFAALCVLATLTRIDVAAWLSVSIPAQVWPAAGLGVWLAIAPQTWGWVGPISPAVTTASAGLAAATGVIMVTLVASGLARSRQVHTGDAGNSRE